MQKTKSFLRLLIIALLISLNLSAQENPKEITVDEILNFDSASITQKATEAYESGNYNLAAQYYLKIVSHESNNAVAAYNLACCYGLLGDSDLSAKFLRRAWDAGFTRLEWIKDDTDFEKVRKDSTFKKTLQSIINEHETIKNASGELIYFDANVLSQCYVQVPQSLAQNKSHTLLVGLHGYGQNPDVFARLWRYFENPTFIFAALQAPYPILLPDGMGFSWTIEDLPNDDQIKVMREVSQQYILQAISDLKKKYNFDKIYLMGFSQGARFAMDTAISNPHIFNGAICIAGNIQPQNFTHNELQKAHNINIFLAYGKNDPGVALDLGWQAMESLSKEKFDVELLEFDGGHDITPLVLKKIETWMKND